MIVTSKANELTGHSHLLGAGLQVWRDVHFEVEAPYFWVVYSVSEINGRVRQNCLTWREEDLIALCDQIEANPNSNLIRVCLLSPPWMNGSNLWRIDAIQKITGAKHHMAGTSSCYILENGAQLIGSRASPYSNDWRTMDEKFSIDKYRCISDFNSPQCIEIFGAPTS